MKVSEYIGKVLENIDHYTIVDREVGINLYLDDNGTIGSGNNSVSFRVRVPKTKCKCAKKPIPVKNQKKVVPKKAKT